MDRDVGKPVFDFFILFASAVGFYLATTLPEISMAGGLSPASFPKVISGGIFVCAVPCLIRDTLEWLGAKEQVDGGHKHNAVLSKGWIRWLLVVVIIIAYVMSLEKFGYILSTVLFCFFCVLGLAMSGGELSNKRLVEKLRMLGAYIAFSVVLSVSVYFVFTQMFNIPLPS